MVLGWRSRKKKGRKAKVVEVLVTPNQLQCPISLELMKDPVTLSTGITYDRESIERWFGDGNYTCPVANQTVANLDLIPNHALRIMIQHWCVQNRQHGVDRIPTPRIPITPAQVAEAVARVKASASASASGRRLDQHGCLQLVQKIEKWGAESERNRRCIAENGAPAALASAFDAFARERNGNVSGVLLLLHHILSALNSMFPLPPEAREHLGSPPSLRCMAWLLKHQDLAGKERSIVALQELLSFGDHRHVEVLSQIEGLHQLLLEFLDQRIFSPTITKASLALVWHLVSSSSPSSEKMTLQFIELGLVSSVLDTLVDSERSLCEKALAVFDSLCTCEEGREKAYSNALAVPLLVKKLLRVSAWGTDCSVSAMWKLCKFGEWGGEMVLVEALQVGAFQKLLLVLQVGCGDKTKEKATELLKLLYPYRAAGECIDSDFKNLKRSM